MIFTVNFEKYGDGRVAVASVDAIPTWVNLSDGCYRVIPLDKEASDWKTAFGLNDFTLDAAKRSYERTMSLVGQGIDEFNNKATSAKKVA